VSPRDMIWARVRGRGALSYCVSELLVRKERPLESIRLEEFI